MAIATKPDTRPQSPFFSSGPCAKRPGWSLEALNGAYLGRSHRAKAPKAALAEVIDLARPGEADRLRRELAARGDDPA